MQAVRNMDEDTLKNVYKNMESRLCFLLRKKRWTFRSCDELKIFMGIVKNIHQQLH